MNDREKAYRRLLEAAIRAAIGGPARLDQWTRSAGIPKEALVEIRASLDELGVDWRKLRAATGRPPVKE